MIQSPEEELFFILHETLRKFFAENKNNPGEADLYKIVTSIVSFSAYNIKVLGQITGDENMFNQRAWDLFQEILNTPLP